MKTKTIKSIIRGKINKWLESITDPEVRALAEKNTIVTGGCITSMLLNEKVNDFDIYFRTLEAATRIAQYYVTTFEPIHEQNSGFVPNIFVVTPKDDYLAGGGRPFVKIKVQSAGIAGEKETEVEYAYFEQRGANEAQAYADSFDQLTQAEALDILDNAPAEVVDTVKPPYRPVFMSSNAITLSDKIQIVLRFIGEPEEIHKFYDFVHCTCHWQSWDNELVLPSAALEAILTKELRYVGSLFPVCSVIRIRKFVARGWTINAGQILKMLMQISNLDLNDVTVLEDQLTGVDVAYFLEVIHKLKAKQEETGESKIDGTYLMTILDRMF